MSIFDHLLPTVKDLWCRNHLAKSPAVAVDPPKRLFLILYFNVSDFGWRRLFVCSFFLFVDWVYRLSHSQTVDGSHMHLGCCVLTFISIIFFLLVRINKYVIITSTSEETFDLARCWSFICESKQSERTHSPHQLRWILLFTLVCPTIFLRSPGTKSAVGIRNLWRTTVSIWIS